MPATRRSLQRLAHSTAVAAVQPTASPLPTLPTIAPPSTEPARSSSKKKKQTKEAATSEANHPSASTATVPATPLPSAGLRRCWNTDKVASIRYHDEQWGHAGYFFPPSLDPTTPQYQRCIKRLFQLQTLELMQAGISWAVVFNKWQGFERAFAQFDVATVAAWGDREVERLMRDEGIVRNRLKVLAILSNARTIHRMETDRPNSFLLLLLAYHIHPPTLPPSSSPSASPSPSPSASPSYHLIHPQERTLATGQHLSSWMRSDFTTPAMAREVSDGVHPSRTVAHLSARLREEGFRFMGETVVLSWMQAIGLMNHHAVTCPEYEKCEREWAELVGMVQREVGSRPSCCGWLAREEAVTLKKAAVAGNKRGRKGKQAKPVAAAHVDEEKEEEKEAETQAEEPEVKDEDEEKEERVSKQQRRTRRQRQ